jgi:D-lactate dehydrogenase
MKVVRVPKYSPQAVAEFAVGLYLCLNRKIHKAHDRVRAGNFSISGLVGHDVYKQTIGIVGCGAIGKHTAQIFSGFGSRVIAYDPNPDLEWAKKFNLTFTSLEDLLKQSDVVSLHAPLNQATRHLINERTLAMMKPDSYLINTSRGGLIHTPSLIHAIKTRRLAGAALDVYEEEEHIFFRDRSEDIIDDEQFAVLNSFPNVLITSHQAFLTEEAITEIARVTIESLLAWASGKNISKNVEL